jgi:glyoxylase-like metal-dependent hydrolase (beta-lactamase superfamily II)
VVLVERIVAPNPGPMTLTGTNTYLVGDGAGELAVIDPGPEDASHLGAILATAARLGRVSRVIVTHHHLDHLPAAGPVCRQTGAPLVGHPGLPGVECPVHDGEVAFDSLVAFETPGHTRDSICLWSAADRALFTGDLVLGSGTAVLDDAPGALRNYLASLERLRGLEPRTIYPGHGPVVADGVAKLTEYLAHRRQRVQQVVDALGRLGPSTAEALAAAIYTDTPAHLLPMAARNVRANLDLLQAEGKVEAASGPRYRLTA